MIKYYTRGLTLLLVLIKSSTLCLAHDFNEVEIAIEGNRMQRSIASGAFTIVQNTKAEILSTKTLSPESLDTARVDLKSLQRTAFSLLTPEQRSAFKKLSEHTLNLDPKILKCARVLSEQGYENLSTGLVQLAAASALYYFGYTWTAIVAALIPTELFASEDLNQLLYCKGIWAKHDLHLSNAEWIRINMDAIIDTLFFNLTVLQMKYNDLAELPWENSESWGNEEKKKVEVILEKMDMLLRNIYFTLMHQEAQQAATAIDQ